MTRLTRSPNSPPNQRSMLLKVNRLGRYVFSGQANFRGLLDDLILRGLARKSSGRGTLITGRGMVLKEWLELQEGSS